MAKQVMCSLKVVIATIDTIREHISLLILTWLTNL